MSLVPIFEVGVWNAWILTTLLFLFMMLPGLLPRDIGKRLEPPEGITGTRIAMMIVFFAMIALSIFLPLKLGTTWFWVGLALYVLGIAVSCAALWTIGATRPGDPWTTGVYRYSRHPIALGTLLAMIGVGIASASWLFLRLAVILMVISHLSAVAEERATAEKFGDAYEAYLTRTPRWIGLPRSVE
jgi:protein-S-isoprenylcysteine O-methyltransferase Ste14